MNAKTRYVLITFLSTSLCVAGCSSGEDSKEQARAQIQQNMEKEIYLDTNKRTYTLRKNSDGTETAVYDDGSTVTFTREEDNSLSYISGAAHLLPGMAIGYLLAKGIYTNSMEERRDHHGQPVFVPVNARKATPNEIANSKYSLSSIKRNASTRAHKFMLKANSTYPPAPVRGFGSAGARSSAIS